MLGVTGIGWLVAAVYSVSRLWRVASARDGLLTLHASQAAAFQLVAGAVLWVLAMLVVGGFLVLGGESSFLPSMPVVDPFSLAGSVVIALWLAAVLTVPAWYGLTLALAWRATRRSTAGELYAYPVVGEFVWEEAPRFFRWLRVQPPAEEPLLESAE